MLCNVHCSSSTQALCLCITLQIVVLCLCLHGWKSPNKSASVLWSIKLWLILPVMWKQRVYKMPSHNSAVSLGPKKVNVAVREFVCLHGEDQMDCCFMVWSRFFSVRVKCNRTTDRPKRISAWGTDILQGMLQLFSGLLEFVWMLLTPQLKNYIFVVGQSFTESRWGYRKL